MDIILVPGFWLDASSWEEVTPALEAAGHTVHPLTLPGLESVDADRSGISLRDHVDAVVRVVDSLEGKPILVGHSGGGSIISAVADARPERIARCMCRVPNTDTTPSKWTSSFSVPGFHWRILWRRRRL